MSSASSFESGVDRYDVYISYPHLERGWAERLFRELSDLGLRCFVDTALGVGETWTEALKQALESSRALVVLWSSAAEESKGVLTEVARFEALSRQADQPRLVVPVVFGDADSLRGAPQELSSRKAVFIGADAYAQGPEAESDEWTMAVATIATSLGVMPRVDPSDASLRSTEAGAKSRRLSRSTGAGARPPSLNLGARRALTYASEMLGDNSDEPHLRTAALVGALRASALQNMTPTTGDVLRLVLGRQASERSAEQTLAAAAAAAELRPINQDPDLMSAEVLVNSNVRGLVQEAVEMQQHTSSDGVHLRHVLATGLQPGVAGEALAELAVTLPELRAQSRASIARTWPDESQEGWDDILGERAPGEGVAAGAPRDRVEWLTDAPASDDLLKRKPLAEALAERLRRIHDDEKSRGTSFLVHIDGPWGSGKSTLLEFLRDDLSTAWLVVSFDAWRQSRVGPPWWSLLTTLRHDLTRGLGWRARLKLWVAELAERVRRAGAPYALGLVFLVVVAAGLFLLLRPKHLDASGMGDLAKTISAIAAAVATLWVGALVVSRFLLWNSPVGARLYEQSHQNPMESLASHFAWLLEHAGRPVIFFIDDLDRCDEAYVVDLLEAVQTLIRDMPQRSRGKAPRDAPYFVVAADGAWLRRSFEKAYADFEDAVGQPGRPLGYLFLDKIFQLTVTVPWISATRQKAFIGDLLDLQESEALQFAAERERVRQRVQDSKTDTEALRAMQGARPEVRREVAPVLVAKLNEVAIARATEHALTKFATLLEPNPRAMKRFLNAFAIAQSVLVLQDVFVERDPLALWTILRVRWPALADYLRAHPDAVRDLAKRDAAPADVPRALVPLFGAPEVAAIVRYEFGGPLTADLVRASSGIAEDREERRPDPGSQTRDPEGDGSAQPEATPNKSAEPEEFAVSP